MKTIIYLTIFFWLFFLNVAFSFTSDPKTEEIGTGGRDDLFFLKAKNSKLKKGNDALKQAIEYKKKNKINKANKRLEKALKYFVAAYKENPDNIVVLYYLGFTYNKIGDSIMSEIYYKQALVIDPKDPLTNQRLGELYFYTKRVNLAKEKLEVLESCNCEEYSELKKLLME